jgi:hypothetical protein
MQLKAASFLLVVNKAVMLVFVFGVSGKLSAA